MLIRSCSPLILAMPFPYGLAYHVLSIAMYGQTIFFFLSSTIVLLELTFGSS
jgi:hypothetical protein